MLRLSDVSVIYRGNAALNKFNASASSGDFVTIIGHNGAGKSTLAKVIAGTVLPDEGTITLDNQDITYDSPRARAISITMLYQDPALGSVGNMTVEENLALSLYKGKPLRLQNGRALLRESPHLLDTVANLFPQKHKILREKVSNLSGGQRQMLAFIMATAVPPRILLLDEPAAALDPAAADRMMHFINEFVTAHRMITLLITHDLETALKQGNRLWIMKRGTLAKQIGQEKSEMYAHDVRALL